MERKKEGACKDEGKECNEHSLGGLASLSPLKPKWNDGTGQTVVRKVFHDGRLSE